MKNQIKNYLVTFLLMVSGYSIYATSFSITDVVVSSDDKILKITVKDSNHGIIFTKVINEVVAQSPNNYLPKLNKGNYTLEIESEFAIQIQPFSVNNLDVTFKSNFNYTIFKPHIITEGKKVNLSRFSPNMEMVKVRIFDYYGHLLHEELIENQIRMNRTYDFSQITESQISIVLESNTRTFTENITF